MNDLAKKQEVQIAPPVNEGAAILQIIERASTNPSVDVEKMERLFTMHKEIIARQAEQAFSAAMSDAQSRSRRVEADASNPQTRSKYASYAALDRALRPIYTDAGFSLSFDTGDAPKPEDVRVVCYVAHSGGHCRTYHIDMNAEGKGAKGGDVMTKTHATGAAMSYGMRYLLKMIFNVAVGEDDDDGNGGNDELDKVVLHNFEVEIANLKNKAEASALWRRIAAACKAAGDKQSYGNLKNEITLKGETFKGGSK